MRRYASVGTPHSECASRRSIDVLRPRCTSASVCQSSTGAHHQDSNRRNLSRSFQLIRAEINRTARTTEMGIGPPKRRRFGAIPRLVSDSVRPGCQFDASKAGTLRACQQPHPAVSAPSPHQARRRLDHEAAVGRLDRMDLHHRPPLHRQTGQLPHRHHHRRPRPTEGGTRVIEPGVMLRRARDPPGLVRRIGSHGGCSASLCRGVVGESSSGDADGKVIARQADR